VIVCPPGLTVRLAKNPGVADSMVTVTCTLCPSVSKPSAGEMTSVPAGPSPSVWEMLQVTGPFSAVSVIVPLGWNRVRTSSSADTASVPGADGGVWVAVGTVDGGGGEDAGVPVDEGGAGVVRCLTNGVAGGLVVIECSTVGCVATRAGALAALMLADACGVGVR
jgi:hypothetical protein